MLEWQIRGCRFRLHFLFAAVVCFLLFTDLRDTALFSLLTVLLHEGGHLLVMLLCRVPPAEMHLQPFGITIVQAPALCRSYAKDALIALGGPLCNGVCALLLLLLPNSDFRQSALLLHGVLGGFNLLPVASLDGGRALESLLCLWRTPGESRRICLVVSWVLILPLLALGLALLLCSGRNPTLLFAACYLMVCLILQRQNNGF